MSQAVQPERPPARHRKSLRGASAYTRLRSRHGRLTHDLDTRRRLVAQDSGRTANANDGRVAHPNLTAAGAKVNNPVAKGTIEEAAQFTSERMKS